MFVFVTCTGSTGLRVRPPLTLELLLLELVEY